MMPALPPWRRGDDRWQRTYLVYRVVQLIVAINSENGQSLLQLGNTCGSDKSRIRLSRYAAQRGYFSHARDTKVFKYNLVLHCDGSVASHNGDVRDSSKSF